MDKQAKLEYSGKQYLAFTKGEDEIGAGSIRDLARDFSKDIVSNLDFIMEDSNEYETALWVIQEVIYDFVKFDILNFLADKRTLKPPKVKLEFPPKIKGTEIWQTT